MDTIRLLVGCTLDCLKTGVHTCGEKFHKFRGATHKVVGTSFCPSVRPLVCPLHEIYPGINTIRLLVGCTLDCLKTGVHTCGEKFYKFRGATHKVVGTSFCPSVRPLVCPLQKLSYSIEISKIYSS